MDYSTTKLGRGMSESHWTLIDFGIYRLVNVGESLIGIVASFAMGYSLQHLLPASMQHGDLHHSTQRKLESGVSAYDR